MQTLSDKHSTGRTLYHEWDSICIPPDCTGQMPLIYYISWARLYCKHHFFINSILYKPELQTCRLCLIDTPTGRTLYHEWDSICTSLDCTGQMFSLISCTFVGHVLYWKPHFFIHNILYKPELQTCTLCLIDTPPGVPCTTSETLSAPIGLYWTYAAYLLHFLGTSLLEAPFLYS